MGKNILDKTFKHSTWFKGQGKTTREVLDYFAKNGYILQKKISKQQSSSLFEPIAYEDCIKDGRSSYTLSEEEKDYYINRLAYWEEQKKIEEEQWLNTEIDADKEIRCYLAGNSSYDTRDAERQIDQWSKLIGKHEEAEEMICYWEVKLNNVLKKRRIIDDMITSLKDTIRTNRDMMNFKEMVNSI